MLPIVVSLMLFITVAGSILIFGYFRYVRPSRLVEQITSDTLVAQPRTLGVPAKKEGAIVKVIQEIGQKVPASPKDVGDIRKRLIMAGFRSDAAAPIFRGAQVVAAIGGAALGFSLKLSMPTMSVLLPVVFGVISWMLPSFVLGRLVKSRQEALRLALPDALDLLVICVEAGMGLDQAIQKVAQELAITHKQICEEFNLVVLEARAGKRRTEALHNLAERTGQQDLTRLVQVLAQSDRFGTSTADALRAHSDFMRVKRRQDAEERANQVSVKLVFPIFFFILPAMVAVAAGPAMIRVFKLLLPIMNNTN